MLKYFSDKRTYAANTSEIFRKIDHLDNLLFEAELAKAQIEHKETTNIEFFIVQYANLGKLEISYNVSTNFCDMNKLKELEMDTDALYLFPAKCDSKDFMRADLNAE